MTLTQFAVLYLAAINAATFVTYGIDKLKARKGWWRISEATLLLLAAAGGSVGAILGMQAFHHKTQHLKFKYGLPSILFLQLLLAGYGAAKWLHLAPF